MKAASITVTLTGVIAIAIPDQPGGLARAIKVLSDRQISIEYMYAFLNPNNATAFVILRVEDNEKALQALQDGNIRIMKESEIYEI